MAIALILFCVFQVMTALSHVTATSSLPSVLLNTTLPVAADMAADSEEKHDKRSLNAFPFESKYLGTETMTLEILNNGTVRGVRNHTPSFGIMQFTLACMMKTITPSLDKREDKEYGRVSMKWLESNRYLCMNQDGTVYSSDNCTDECEFKQELDKDDHHYRLHSLKYGGLKPRKKLFKNKKSKKRRRNKKWYIAINRTTGEMLSGRKSRKKKKHSHLIPRPIVDHGYKETLYSLTTTTEPHVLERVSLDPKGSVSVDQSREENFFQIPTSQISNSGHQRSKNNGKNKNPNRRRHGANKRNQDCDPTIDPLNLFRLNMNCRRKSSKSSRNRGGSVHFSSTPFNNQNARGATSNPAQKRTSRANLFSFSPKR